MSRFYNNFSSMSKEDGDNLQETEDELEDEDGEKEPEVHDNESPG